MAKVNQSTANAFPQGDSAISSREGARAAWPRIAVMVAAWFEIIVGVSFILATNAQTKLVFAATTDGVGTIFARFSGVAIIGLGIACLPSKRAGTNRNAVRGLLIFNVAATIFFAWVGLGATLVGVMLWPVVIMHAVLALALALSLKHGDF